MLRAATILITLMTQRNERRFTALEVLSGIEKLNTIMFDVMLLQDVADWIGFDGSMTRSLDDGMAVGGIGGIFQPCTGF